MTNARTLAAIAHGDQKYGDQPYLVHLDAVVAVLTDAGYTEPDILAAGYLHDALEDTPLTVKDLRQEGVPEAAVQGVLFCTDEPGHNRKTRKAATYARVKAQPNPIGIPVKWADRIANKEACIASGNTSLHDMYLKENATFTDAYMPPEGSITQDPRFQALLHRYANPRG